MDGKKFNISNGEVVVHSDENEVYKMKKIGSAPFNTMRPMILNSVIDAPAIGGEFVDCLSISKSFIVGEDRSVDITISGTSHDDHPFYHVTCTKQSIFRL